ncbi:hypothetical protein SAMN05428988_0817 [Chitinophaga sp. YR573]|uniref:hypothetical protein n=1 Tax=Chitinophaga sp. YR573 TaxID=1881040 RepID=UPI0008D3DC94|nr:hypothetical protein [Chitinophaga sp. YR573]SEV96137.1 hypothetical protein SAMN05428988_0817 [Chitinophaga sp. YR573]
MKLELLLLYLLAYASFGDLLASLSAYIADPNRPLLCWSPKTGKPEVVTNHI